VTPILGLENYSASKTGQIYSHRTRIFLKFQKSHKGYLRVSLRGKNYPIHKIIFCAFNGLDVKKTRLQINHKNGVKTDNRLENLEKCTTMENLVHALRTGLRTSNGTNTFFNENDVQLIRFYGGRKTNAILAKLFKRKIATIQNCFYKRSYSCASRF
jgi:hypothetical protein